MAFDILGILVIIYELGIAALVIWLIYVWAKFTEKLMNKYKGTPYEAKFCSIPLKNYVVGQALILVCATMFTYGIGAIIAFFATPMLAGYLEQRIDVQNPLGGPTKTFKEISF